MKGLLRRSPRELVVREYGRDSLLVWANLLLAPLSAALGLRVGLQSEERLAALIEADTAAMRGRGYLVKSVEALTLPGLAGRAADARWYRVTFERSAPRSVSRTDQPGAFTQGNHGPTPGRARDPAGYWCRVTVGGRQGPADLLLTA